MIAGNTVLLQLTCSFYQTCKLFKCAICQNNDLISVFRVTTFDNSLNVNKISKQAETVLEKVRFFF